MGFLDKFKDAAGDMVQSAIDHTKDKVSDVTGVDTDKLIDAAGSVSDAGSSLTDAADSLREGKLGQ